MRHAFLLTLLVAVATSSPAQTEHDFIVKDFHFASGEVLAEVRMHYVTFGTPHRDATGAIRNAVLILHGTGGSSHQFLGENFAGVLFAPGGVLDARRFFIVIPDNVGHGHSSKPSDGLHARFPRYDYADMIELQHRLLIEGLGITHLYLVLGTSMGAMHAWMWGERWPDAMDAIVPLASAPTQIAGRNRVWRRMIIDEIRNDPEWKDGEYRQQPHGLVAAIHMLLIASSAPLVLQKTAPTRDDADRWLEGQVKSRLATEDANDLLYAVESSRDYDPSTQLERITAPLLAINSADDFVNPPELGIVETLIKRVKHARFVLIPTSSQTRGHGTHTAAAIWKSELAQFLAAIPTPP